MDFYIDTTNGKLVTSDESTVVPAAKTFTKGDRIPVNLYFLQAQEGASTPYAIINPTSISADFAIGKSVNPPTAGNYYVSFGAQTANIAIAPATAATDLQTGLNALSSISSAGGVSVNGTNGNLVVRFNNAGAQSAFVVDPSYIQPCQEEYVIERNAGSVTAPNEQIIQFLPQAVVHNNSWTDTSSTITASISTTVTGGPTVDEVQRLSFTGEPKGGTLSFTAPSFTSLITALSSGAYATDIPVFTTSVRHGLTQPQPVTLTGLTAISGIVNGTTYFVMNPTTFTFELSKSTTTADQWNFEASVTAVSSFVTALPRQGITINAPLSYDNLVNAISSTIGGNFNLLIQNNTEYDIAFIGDLGKTDVPTLQVTSTLQGLAGKYAAITIGADCLTEQMAGAASDKTFLLEISSSNGTTNMTDVQTSCTIRQEIDR